MKFDRYGKMIGTLIPLLAAAGSASGEELTPYREFDNEGAGFHGTVGETADPESLVSIRIGLLAPPGTREGLALRAGVEMALDEANDGGGDRGTPYELVFRSDTGPWGIAAKQIAAFVYEDRVWAIIGGIDGHRTHLAELIAAKTWVPVLSPTASDLSIDYANVPWVFRLAPDDRRRARVLLDCARDRGWKRLVVLYEGERESRTGVERLAEEANRRHWPLSLMVEYPPGRPGEAMERIASVPSDAVLVWCRAEEAGAVLGEMRSRGLNVPVLFPDAPPEMGAETADPGTVVAAAACDLWSENSELKEFRRRFEAGNKGPLHPYALFGYDAARLIIKAIEAGGLNRARIRNELAEMSFPGLVGLITFDSLGGSRLEPFTVRWEGRRWVADGPGEGGTRAEVERSPAGASKQDSQR